MTEKFFITGLPRSRTAWWAVATNTPASRCVHEPLKSTTKFEDVVRIWDRDECRFSGISDSGLSVQLGRVLTEVKPRTLIVQRDPLDVMTSLYDYLPFRPVDVIALKAHIDQCQAAIDEWRGHELVKVVPYDALRYRDIVTECFEWLLPGHSRFMDLSLCDLNVQVDKAALMASITQQGGHNLWHLK